MEKGNGKGKAIKASSDLEEFSGPVILKSYSQFKTKRMKVKYEENPTPEHIFRKKMNLKLPGKNQQVFKSVLETKTSDNYSIDQNQKFSDDTIFAHINALLPSMERISASDGFTTNTTIIIHNNIILSTIESLGAEECMTSRNLHPRHHMDNSSEKSKRMQTFEGVYGLFR